MSELSIDLNRNFEVLIQHAIGGYIYISDLEKLYGPQWRSYAEKLGITPKIPGTPNPLYGSDPTFPSLKQTVIRWLKQSAINPELIAIRYGLSDGKLRSFGDVNEELNLSCNRQALERTKLKIRKAEAKLLQELAAKNQREILKIRYPAPEYN